MAVKLLFSMKNTDKPSFLTQTLEEKLWSFGYL